MSAANDGGVKKLQRAGEAAERLRRRLKKLQMTVQRVTMQVKG
ncbi:hypothetical protein [Maritalea sp.]